jgi:hypothetical protein
MPRTGGALTSARMSRTDLGGYSCEAVILLNSRPNAPLERLRQADARVRQLSTPPFHLRPCEVLGFELAAIDGNARRRGARCPQAAPGRSHPAEKIAIACRVVTRRSSVEPVGWIRV